MVLKDGSNGLFRLILCSLFLLSPQTQKERESFFI